MSRLARSLVASFATCAVSWQVPAQGQTIADYSRAQRAWLENAMSQSAARSAGAAASASASAVLAPPRGPAPDAAAARSVWPVSMPLPTLPPSVQVSGVFESGTVSLAEVVVNATAYLVQVGQRIPGTVWQVDAIAADRVVLGRRGVAGAGDGEGLRKTFSLPAMR